VRFQEGIYAKMKDLIPINYKIFLKPDLERFEFTGSTEILVESSEPVNEITVNILDLAIWSCRVGIGDDFLGCSFYVDIKKDELTISLPKKISGQIHLKVDYLGHINDKMAGFYRSAYDADGGTKYIAVTQFQESDARRAFPCFDHPGKKATFDVALLIDDELKAISNGAVAEEQMLDNRKKLVRFQQTPRMSTYLLFFGVGDFDLISDAHDDRVRVATMPGMTGSAQVGLEFGRKSLWFCENYYHIPYPLPKLDLIAIPDFAFGAMENWGAITFRENLLLVFEGITSKAGMERICEVIAHEIVHQWFGNLVTPSDWKYLWLNESFATYFAYGIVDHYFPDWKTWSQFLSGQVQTALERDAFNETFPIELPGVEHVAINSSTAPIIYSKGGSVLRQIKGYIGEDDFKEGVKRYLKTHEYGCASSHHFWEAFEEISKEPITKMMKSWVEQPGFPIIEVQRDVKELFLTQKRFSYLQNDSTQEWVVPITIKIFYDTGNFRHVKTLLASRSQRVPIGDGAVVCKVNYGQTGFYRVKYRASDLNELGKRVLNKQLPPEDRWGIQNDLYALAKSGDVSIDDYLDFLGHYEKENDFLPLISISENLLHAHLIMDGNIREKIASAGRSFLLKIFSNIGYEPVPDEPNPTAILRDQVLWQAALYGLKEAVEFSLGRFRSFIQGEVIHQDIIKSVMQVGALHGNHSAFEHLEKRFQSSKSEHERMNILTAMGCFSDKAAIEESQYYILDKVPNRNKFVPIVSLASNPHAVPYMWDWYISHLDELERFHSLLYERVIAAIVPVSGIGREKEVNGFFNNYLIKNAKHSDVIKLALEELKVNCRMRGV
jgi:aminopeptidase N